MVLGLVKTLSPSAAVHKVHLVQVVLVIGAPAAVLGGIRPCRMRMEVPTLVTVRLVPDELLTRLLVVAETAHVGVTVIARLPGTRLPVLFVIGAPDAALAQVATAATGIAPLIEEAAGGTARLVVARDNWAAAAAGVLSVLLLLCLRAAQLVYRAVEGVQRIQLLLSQPLPVRLLSLSHR